MQVLDAVPGDEATWPLQYAGFQVEISCFDSFWSLKHCSSAQPDLTCRLAIRMLTKTIDLQPAIFMPTSLSSHLIIPTPRSSLPPVPPPPRGNHPPSVVNTLVGNRGLTSTMFMKVFDRNFAQEESGFKCFGMFSLSNTNPNSRKEYLLWEEWNVMDDDADKPTSTSTSTWAHFTASLWSSSMGGEGGEGGRENGRPWRVSVGSRVIVRKQWWNLKQVFTFVIQQDWPSWKYSFENICWCLKMVRQHIKKNRDRLSQQEKQHNGKCCAMKCWEKSTQNVLHF